MSTARALEHTDQAQGAQGNASGRERRMQAEGWREQAAACFYPAAARRQLQAILCSQASYLGQRGPDERAAFVPDERAVSCRSCGRCLRLRCAARALGVLWAAPALTYQGLGKLRRARVRKR